LKTEENDQGEPVENKFLQLLYRVLHQPVVNVGESTTSQKLTSILTKREGFNVQMNLIRLARLCSETSLSSFLNNVADFRKLAEQENTVVLDLFENSFRQSESCSQVKQLKWRSNIELSILHNENEGSSVTEEQLNKKFGFKNVVNREVEVRNLDLDWIHKNGCDWN